MSRRLLRAGAIAAGIGSFLAWGLLQALPWPARAFTAFLLVPLPILMLMQVRLAGQLPEEQDREAVYVSSAVSIWALAALAMVSARFSDFTRAELWLAAPEPWSGLLAAAAVTVAGLALMVLGRLLGLPETPLIEYLLPRTGNERIAFAGLSVSAGIAEELVFRAFLIAALLKAGATLATAVALSIAAFAVAHAYQGVFGVFRVALLGGLLTAPILLTGSIYPSMVAHAALDLIAGLLLADWLTGGAEH